MTDPKPTVRFNMPMREYISAPGISKHALDEFTVSPQNYLDYISGKLETERTRPMLLGSMLHGFVLEGKKDWVVPPRFYPTKDGDKPWNRNATVCREWEAAQVNDVLTSDEEDYLLEARYAIDTDPRCQELLATGQAEVSMFARGCKGRADWMSESGITDLKSTANPETEWFAREIAQRRYHVQAGLYTLLAEWCDLPQRRFYFIAVGKSRPVRVNVRELAPGAIVAGREIALNQIAAIRNCQERNEWPGLSGSGTKIHEIDVPAWAYPVAVGDEPEWMRGE